MPLGDAQPDGEVQQSVQVPVDDLRQRLRSLGYLDAGVDRFVLGPARGSRGAASIAVHASLRIGLLGALLLAPTAALAVASSLPGLVTGVRDHIVVAVYMAALFGAAITAAALMAGLLVWVAARRTGTAIARHARTMSVAAGVIVGGATLAYLTLLWTAVQDAGVSEHASLSMGAAVAASVAISLVLGHAVMLSALALVVAGTGAPVLVKGVPGASWRVMLGAGAVSFAAALLLANAGTHAGEASREPVRLTVVPSGIRVRLFAIDGFDPALFASLPAGRAPSLEGLFQGAGAHLVLQDPGESAVTRLDPARLWTTVATAQPASVHGVRTLETRRVAGVSGALPGGDGSRLGRLVGTSTDLLRLSRPSVASGSQRREKTFWEVAADAGLRTAVVNWWATWPALSGTGTVLSDRATLRLERGGALDAEISPPALYGRLAAEWPALRQRADVLATAAVTRGQPSGDLAPVLHRSAVIDALTLLLAREVSDADTDLTVTYLPGLDIAQHALADNGDGGGQSASAMAARLGALESYYVALDSLLASAVRAASDDLIVVVTAPGRVAAGSGGRLLIRGRGVRPGTVVEARGTDVAPTILYALGLPTSDALAGAPLVSLFDAGFVERYAVRHVPTYGPRMTSRIPSSGQPLDEEMVDRLRSLGYVR